MKCPICGARVVYEGLNSIECEGAPKPAVPEFHGIMGGAPPRPAVPAKPACPNYRVPAVPEGSFDWARMMWLRGYVMQVRQSDGHWTGEPDGAAGQVMPNVNYGDRPWRIHPQNPFPVCPSREKPSDW